MKSPQGTTWSPHLVFCLIFLFLTFTVQASDICAASQWPVGSFLRRQLTSTSTSIATASANASISITSSLGPQPTSNVTISSLITDGNITAGEVNCRYTGSTSGLDINYYTCTLLANQYGISAQTFFLLNPDVDLDCGNIQANTDYCVAGFIEPVRATSGLCGPQNGNATCLGTAYQCCNANTFTCGNSTEDCAPGTCYEGACLGDSIYTTTGVCGKQNGYRMCAGVWGDCCNVAGQCGSGDDFCGIGNCQLGNCTIPVVVPSLPPYINGNSTDGTCGGANSYTCNNLYGNCCNKDGICGGLPSDCGAGCQSQWGTCNPPVASISSTTTSSTALSTSSIVKTSGPITTTSSESSSSASTTSGPTTTTSSSLPPSTSVPGEAALPSCGILCFNNMLAQYSALGCATPEASCLCSNVNFGYGLRDCADGACGTAVASTVIGFGSSYCASATGT